MKKNIYFLSFEHSDLTDIKTTQIACKKWISTHLKYTSNVLYNNWYQSTICFSSFVELTIQCVPIESILVDLLVFEPNTPILLPNRLDISYLLNAFKFRQQMPIVMIRHLKGITLEDSKCETTPASFRGEEKPNFWTILFLEYSNFDFYLNETTLVTAQYCRREYFSKGNGFKSLWPQIGFKTSFYTSEVCPYVFMESNVRGLIFADISNSLIFKNRLRFMQINETGDESYTLDMSSKLSVELFVAYEEITTSLLNEFVFRRLAILYIKGNVKRIQDDLFKYFKEIRIVQLHLDNFETFFGNNNKNNSLAWLSHLNKNVHFDTKKSINPINFDMFIMLYLQHVKYIFKKEYAYPDTDLCLFKGKI